MNRCAICEHASLCEDDHFPVADRNSGNTTWPLCRACHDMTDRLPLDKWHPGLIWGALTTLFDKANRDERLILVKLFKISLDHNFTVKHQAPRGQRQGRNTQARQPRNTSQTPINYEDRVLAAISEHGWMTRTAIVRQTHGKNHKISHAVRRLVESGRLRETSGGLLGLSTNRTIQQTVLELPHE